MEKEYTKEEWWKLYEQLPPALQEAIFSPENAKTFAQICQRHNIADKSETIAKYIGRVLLGLLPVEDFQIKLEEELNFEEGLTKEVFHDINRFIFTPVKAELNQIYYGTQPPAPAGPKAQPQKEKYREPIEGTKTEEVKTEPTPEIPKPATPKSTPSPSKGKNRYREPIK